MSRPRVATLRTVGLFAGIGGIELGLEAAGAETLALCEIDPAAQAVLGDHFASSQLWSDVRGVRSLPACDVISAGFPCQDLSQAGRKEGIEGSQSSLVGEVFRLARRTKPTWLVIENVSYMLRLDRGRAMHQLVTTLDEMGYRWAYRVVDARSFGVPQRRQRVVMVASPTEDPRTVLFADDVVDTPFNDAIGLVDVDCAYGFYWTEGRRGLGWARDAVPTVKGGSRLGIPSAPAVWLPDSGTLGTPEIEDGERLQGFPPDWTLPAEDAGFPRSRWHLVGNAVCVPMARWLGSRLAEPGRAVVEAKPLSPEDRWPVAAYGYRGERVEMLASVTPRREPYSLRKFLRQPLRPLSHRATAGFYNRACEGRLRFAEGFLEDVEAHIEAMADVAR